MTGPSLWAACWLTDDGPSVDLYATQEAAYEAILAWLEAEGYTREEAIEHYENTGDEWVVPVNDLRG